MDYRLSKYFAEPLNAIMVEIKLIFYMILIITCDCFMQQPFWKNNPENNKKLINLFFNLVQAS